MQPFLLAQSRHTKSCIHSEPVKKKEKKKFNLGFRTYFFFWARISLCEKFNLSYRSSTSSVTSGGDQASTFVRILSAAPTECQ